VLALCTGIETEIVLRAICALDEPEAEPAAEDHRIFLPMRHAAHR
jgi:hypothetical protein